MGYLLTTIFTTLDLLTFTILSASFSELRWSRKRTLGIMMASLPIIVLSLDLIPGEAYRFVSIPIMFLIIVAVFRGPWYIHLLPVLLSYTLVGIIDTGVGYGVCALLGITFNEFIWKKMLYTIVSTSAKLIEVLLAYLFCKYWRRRKYAPIRASWLLLTVLFPAVSFVMLLIIYIGFQDRSDLSAGALIFTLVLAMANVAIIYLIHAWRSIPVRNSSFT